MTIELKKGHNIFLKRMRGVVFFSNPHAQYVILNALDSCLHQRESNNSHVMRLRYLSQNGINFLLWRKQSLYMNFIKQETDSETTHKMHWSLSFWFVALYFLSIGPCQANWPRSTTQFKSSSSLSCHSLSSHYSYIEEPVMLICGAFKKWQELLKVLSKLFRFYFLSFLGSTEEGVGGLFHVSFRDGIYCSWASTSLFFFFFFSRFILSCVWLQKFDSAFHNFANPH